MHILYKGFGRDNVKNKAFARKVSEVMYVHKGANYRVVRFKNSLDDVVRNNLKVIGRVIRRHGDFSFVQEMLHCNV